MKQILDRIKEGGFMQMSPMWSSSEGFPRMMTRITSATSLNYRLSVARAVGPSVWHRILSNEKPSPAARIRDTKRVGTRVSGRGALKRIGKFRARIPEGLPVPSEMWPATQEGMMEALRARLIQMDTKEAGA